MEPFKKNPLDTLPNEINNHIYSFIYEDEDRIKKYLDKWKLQNRKITTLFNIVDFPFNAGCYYYLTIIDYNTCPCWLCGADEHAIKECIDYYKDTSYLEKKLNI